MFLFRYWSFWNFGWYLLSEFNIVELNTPLMLSILNTSIIGGFMTYVYPKRIVYEYKNKLYRIKDTKLKILDFLFHQIPFIRMIYRKKNMTISGLYALFPVSLWLYYLQYKNINKDKIYLINFEKLLYSSFLITFSFELFHRNPSLIYKLSR